MRRRLLISAGIAAGLGIAASIALSLALSTAAVQVRVAAAVSRALQRPIGFTALSLDLLPVPSLRVKQLEIAESSGFATDPLLRVDEADLRPRIRSLLGGRLELASIILKKPEVTVIRDAEGRIDVARPEVAGEPEHQTQSAATAPPGGRDELRGFEVRVDDGTVHYVRRRADGSSSELRLERVDLKLAGDERLAVEGRALLEPGAVALEITHGTVDLTGARERLEAAVDAEVALRGDEVADLFAMLLGPTTEVRGALKGTLRIGGTIEAPTARGPVTLSGASITTTRSECPEPRRRRLLVPLVTATVEWSAGRFTSKPTVAEIGDGKVSANVSVGFDGGARIELDDLEATAVPLETVLVDFLCAGHAVTGRLGLAGKAVIGAHPLAASGRVHVGSGKVVGAKSTALLSAILRVGGAVSALLSADLPRSLLSSPLDFDSVTGSYEIGREVLTIRDLAYKNSAMTIGGGGTVQLASGELDLDLEISHGRGLAYAKVTGRGESPSVRVIPSSTLLREVDPRKVERGVRSFIDRLR